LIDQYDWSGGREAMLRFGPATGPVVIAAMPLFEEANRTRAFMVSILRALAERGIASVLPDLPGTGESLTETENTSLNDWTDAFSFVAQQLGADTVVYGIAIRGGALLDAEAQLAGRWHFAPVSGDSLVRDLLRTRLAGSGKESAGEAIELSGPPVELAGNRVARTLLAQLKAANPSMIAPLRTVRLDSDTQPADLKVGGAPLWRRSEPDNDPALARLLADDIAAWIATCAA
jgi:pimeloyl-ACP methyl ester carboxylesterase